MADFSEDKRDRQSVSASPDFAQVYIFLQAFGPMLKLPPVTLQSLEEFFINGYENEDNSIAAVHWKLLTVGYRTARKDWQKSATKCARYYQLCREGESYHELPQLSKLKVFRLCCEEQFDYNVNFHCELKREEMEGLRFTPLLGCDSSGRKHWLLKDAAFDVRLYGETNYDVDPPKTSKWVELARSLDELAIYASTLESARDGLHSPQSKAKHSKATKPAVSDRDPSIQGCIKCRRDIQHTKMLLCDECDRECHTYCQYPKLWGIPKGKWSCPICKEDKLISELKRVYNELSVAKTTHDKTAERKQRSFERLQRTGLLMQNIILEDEGVARQPRRSRKSINYAELNDVNLPRLGKRDYVGYHGSYWSPPPASRRQRAEEYIQEDYLAPRIRNTSRRFRGSPIPTTTAASNQEDSQNLSHLNNGTSNGDSDKESLFNHDDQSVDVAKDEAKEPQGNFEGSEFCSNELSLTEIGSN